MNEKQLEQYKHYLFLANEYIRIVVSTEYKLSIFGIGIAILIHPFQKLYLYAIDNNTTITKLEEISIGISTNKDARDKALEFLKKAEELKNEN